MVTYYIGNVREKRALFRRERRDAAVADNCDVLADFKLNGKVCFVLGDIPYGSMRVGEYVRYACALNTLLPLSDGAVRERLRAVGVRVRLDRKMRTLPRYLFRAVLLAAAKTEDTKSYWINWDGIAYTRRQRRRFARLLRRMERTCDDVRAAVSDCRFLPRRARVMTVANGAVTPGRSPSRSRRCGTLRFARKKCKESYALKILSGRETLLCDN